jgi:hypothetical protein
MQRNLHKSVPCPIIFLGSTISSKRLSTCEDLATALSDEDLVRHQNFALVRN